jgi:hypothetical protein
LAIVNRESGRFDIGSPFAVTETGPDAFVYRNRCRRTNFNSSPWRQRSIVLNEKIRFDLDEPTASLAGTTLTGSPGRIESPPTLTGLESPTVGP